MTALRKLFAGIAVVAGFCATAAMLAACGSQRGNAQGASAEADEAGPQRPVVSPGRPFEKMIPNNPAYLPRAVVYRMSGDYADNVPVQLDDNGNLISYPAPGDIPADAEPVRLRDGWLLSPVGVSANTAFTRWTYAEYRALPEAPTPAEVADALIPGARVTETRRLSMTAGEALADTAAVNRALASGGLQLAPRRGE